VNEPIHAALSDIAAFLQEHGVPFAIIGGLAVTARGEPRSTADVDAVIATDVAGGLALLKELRDSPFLPFFSGVEEVVEKAFLLPLRHRATNVKVDLALGMTGFEREAIRRATATPLGGCTVPVVSAEDLILMKLLASRARDTEDARRIVERQGESLDWRYLEETARGLEEVTGQDVSRPLRELR